MPLFIRPITVGPASTMNVAGKMNSTSGKLIFTDALAAISSAACWRLMRSVSAWMRSAWAMLVPKRSAWISIAASDCSAGVAGALPEVLQRVGARQADARFHVGDAELAADRRVGERQLLPDALHGGVDGEAGLDADDHQVERVGQAVRQRLLVAP